MNSPSIVLKQFSNWSSLSFFSLTIFICFSRSVAKLSTASSPKCFVVEKNNQTFFVCHCGFSSTNKSGSSRHKCRSTEAAVIFPCKDCGKICQNAGSLRRHVQAKHGSRQSVSLPVGYVTKAPDSDNSSINNSGQF